MHRIVAKNQLSEEGIINLNLSMDNIIDFHLLGGHRKNNCITIFMS